jgi:hypothetical protein
MVSPLVVSVFVGFLSAACWLFSALLSFWTGGSYYGGPPKHIRRLDRASKLLNAAGAFLAAVSIGLQSYSNS